MTLQRAPGSYDRTEQAKFRTELEQMDRQNRKRGQDVEIVGAERLILASPNGQRWSLTVDNAGTLAAEALT